MRTLGDLLDFLDRVAPFRLAEEWDNVGLQAGSPSLDVEGIFVALDPKAETVARAEARGCNVVLTHHPLLFRPVSRVDTDRSPGRVLGEALGRGVAVVSLHTNLDAAPGGINDILSELLGLEEVEVLEESEPGAGIGRVGNLPKPLTVSAFLSRVVQSLGAMPRGVVGPRTAEIRRVAVVGGAGGGLVRLCAEKGAQLLVTGDVGHHQALESEAWGICVVDAGHYQTERRALEIFCGRLERQLFEKGWRVKVCLDGEEKDPIEMPSRTAPDFLGNMLGSNGAQAEEERGG